jgi:hypothetical protein
MQLTAAVKRCATQNQAQHLLFPLRHTITRETTFSATC